MKTFREFLNESLTLNVSSEHRPGIYSGRTESKRGKKKTHDHEVYAKNEAEAHDIMRGRHREHHKIHALDHVSVGYVQYHGEKKKQALPPPKLPHIDSREQKHRDEMLKRYDTLKYKGD
jgi:hypothetical protein